MDDGINIDALLFAFVVSPIIGAIIVLGLFFCDTIHSKEYAGNTQEAVKVSDKYTQNEKVVKLSSNKEVMVRVDDNYYLLKDINVTEKPANNRNEIKFTY